MTKELLSIMKSPDRISQSPFEVLKKLAALVNKASVKDSDAPDTQELLLYALENRRNFGEAGPVLNSLLHARGLYPYTNESPELVAETLEREAHRQVGLPGVIFHRKQSEVYERLIRGENVALSAPTSFGKSLIVDALIASGRYTNVAVIVPTIALIDETRRRLSRQFGHSFKILTHASQAPEDQNIFVMTQERVLEFATLPKLDLFVIDEFYKLDPRRDQDRALLLNQVFLKLFLSGAQFYLLGPNIARIPDNFGETLRCTFISTPYATVVSEYVRIESKKNDSLENLIKLCKELDEQTLIYCASPASARRVATALLSAGCGGECPALEDAADWYSDQYHPDWAVTKALRHGIGVHHGRVPRSLAQYAVGAFNDGKLRFLVCTSTLIEGVNTSAKNVVIYDNKVATKKFDFFTFNNIKGRSGRMFRHYVGRVYLFADPPQEDLPFVEVPIVTQDDSTPESLLLQMDNSFLSERSRDRVRDLSKSSLLSLETLRLNNGVDPRAQLSLARRITEDATVAMGLGWDKFPDYNQLRIVCDLIWDYFIHVPRLGGVSSGSQLAYKISQLSKTKSPKKMILKELAAQDSPDADEAVENVLEFVRTWATFNFPKYLGVIDRIQRELLPQMHRRPGNYSVYAATVENLFTKVGVIALDEYGIPIQIGEKLLKSGGNFDDIDSAIARLRALTVRDKKNFSRFEWELIESARDNLGPDRAVHA